MAKKRGRKSTRLDSAAMAAGSALGALAAKVANLNRQRGEVAAEIQTYIKQAQSMLSGLSVKEIPFPKIGAVAKAVTAPKKRRKMSAAARKKIAAAQKTRWARVKAKKSTQ